MPNHERPDPNVAKSLEDAEVRVEAGKLNVDQAIKGQIKVLEADVKGQIARFRASGIYPKVEADFARKQESTAGVPDQITPEFLLINMAFRFDRMRATESASAGESLRVLAEGTLADLAELKKDLDSTGSLLEKEDLAQKVLEEQTSIREKEAARDIEQEIVRGFLEQVHGENTALNAKVKDLRESTQGWTGYGHAIEPSNLVASIGGAFTEGGIETKEMVQLKLYTDYQSIQMAAERGLLALVKAMRGSEKNNQAPKSLSESWAFLQKSNNPDFSVFAGSPEGRLFGRTVVQQKTPTHEDQAQYCYEKAMDLRGRIGAEDAEPYFQAVIHEFPETSFAVEAKKNAMTSGENAYQKFTQVGDIFLRLDMLALMAGSGGAGLMAAKLPQAARVAKLIEAYPHLSKVVPGVKVLKAGETAGLLTKGTLAFGNFTLEVGKFVGAVAAAEKVGGPKAAYAVGMLCFFTPGLVHGFEKMTGTHLEHALASEGPGVLKRLGTYMSERVGGPEGLRSLLVRGLEVEAGAVGVLPSSQIIRGEVGEALRVLGMEARAVGERAATEGRRVSKEVVHHGTDHTVKHNAAHVDDHEAAPGGH